MKYLLLVPDGMADRPLTELGGKTPLEVAMTPNMDKLAAQSLVGLASTIPPGYEPGSDVANLAILGYDPAKYYTGRGPLEAASMGIELTDDQAAWRCNTVTIRDGVMSDFTASHISSVNSSALIKAVENNLKKDSAIRFYPGVSYRNLCVTPDLGEKIKTTPPHDIVGQKIDKYLPKGGGSEILLDLMTGSVEILNENPVNQKLRDEGKNEANFLWIWGGGKAVNMPTLQEKYGLSGAVISAVDLIKGIGLKAGMDVIYVPGATGYLDTDYKAKAEYGLKALKSHDILYLHVEAPDEAGHMGDIAEKIKAIENFDALTLGTMLNELETWADYKLLCLPDHATPIEIKTHDSSPVPFFLYCKSKEFRGPDSFTESSVKEINADPLVAWDLLDLLVKGNVRV